jgi:hypothetical protein
MRELFGFLGQVERTKQDFGLSANRTYLQLPTPNLIVKNCCLV